MRTAILLLALLVLLAPLSRALAQDEVLPVPEDQQIGEALRGPEEPAAPEAAVPPGETVVNPNPLSSLQLESLSTTLSAPLFTPSRTGPVVEAPVEAVAEAPPPPPEVPMEEPPPSLELVGIVMTDAAKTAFLKDPGTNEVHRLNSGEEYEGWSVNVVDARSIEFRSGDRVQELKMFESFPTPAIYGGMPFDPNMPNEEMPPMDPGAVPPPPPPGPQPEEMPPPEEMLQGEGAPNAPAPAAPPENFDPQTGELLIPEEGPLQTNGQ